MIKRIIGFLATLAVLALVVFAALGSGSYKSMVFGKAKVATEQVTSEQKPAAEPVSESAEEVTEPTE